MIDKDDLAQCHCKACEGGATALTRVEAEDYLQQLPDWSLSEDGRSIQRDIKFKGFDKTMGFVNAVAWLAIREDHHPDMEVGYGHCLVRYTTHAIGGLSENDIICALRVDQLLN